MYPPWVLLDRFLHFIEGGSAGDAGRAPVIIGRLGRVMSLEDAVPTMKPDLLVVDPPEVTSLSLVRSLPKDLLGGIKSGMVSSTDKGLVVLYANMYQPGNGGRTMSGGYLVYDASTSALFAIPQLESLFRGFPQLESLLHASSPPIIKCLGASAAILRCRHGVHILAELVTYDYMELPKAYLYLWRSSTPGTSPRQWASLPSARQLLPSRLWVPSEVYLPLPLELCGLKCFFHIDMAFAFEGSICWVDLLTGVLICDLFASGEPKFSFVPLPKECCLYIPDETRLLAGTSPYESRSIGIVCGAIKFVALVGYSSYTEGLPKEEVALKTWTLSPDAKEWKQDAAVLVRDLWESESFREMELPRVVPRNPVLSMNEDEVVYISLCDIEYVDRIDRWKEIHGKDLVLNGHYVLRLDLLQNKVLYSKKSATNSLSLLSPCALASDFSLYLHGRKDSQRGEEASKVGSMVKRAKY